MSDIVAILEGGLGNQMFQYAAAKATAGRTGASLVLDLRLLRDRGDRPYALGDFALTPEPGLIRDGLMPRRNGPLRSLIGKLLGEAAIFREAGFPYDPAILRVKPTARIDGYFQSERYFADYAEVIRRDFMPRPEIAEEIAALAAKLIPEGPSVSLHVRRGDYANPATLAVHGLLGADYYERALRLVGEKAGRLPKVCVFTDEPAWVRAHLRLPADSCYVSERTRTPLQDLMLMARCSHHITANSSFSWWGAWLNPSPTKVVVTPERWFQPASGLDTRDLRPAGWLSA